MATDLSPIFSSFFLLDSLTLGDQALLGLEPLHGEIQAEETGAEDRVAPQTLQHRFLKRLQGWRPGRLWQPPPPSEKEKPVSHEAMAREFLRTGVIDLRTAQQLEAYIFAKVDAITSNSKKWSPDALLELSVLAEALANHVGVNRADRILFKLAQTLQIYFSFVGWRGTRIDKQLIQELLAFLKEGASAALASGNFERAFRISLALFYQAQEFLQWAEGVEDPTIKREALEARLWVKLFVMKISEYSPANGDVKLEADAFLTSFELDVDRMTDRLRRLAYEKEKNPLPSTDRLVAEALLKLAEGSLAEEYWLEAARRFQNLASFQESCPHSFSPCDVATSHLRAAEIFGSRKAYGPYYEDMARQLIEATEALRRFDSKKRKPFTKNPVTLAPWQIDSLRHAWLDLKLTIMARPQGLELDSKEIQAMLSNLATQIKQGSALLEKLKAIAEEPNIGIQFRRYNKLHTLILRLSHWINEATTLLAEVGKR